MMAYVYGPKVENMDFKGIVSKFPSKVCPICLANDIMKK